MAWTPGKNEAIGKLIAPADGNKYFGVGGNFDQITAGQIAGQFLQAASAVVGDWSWAEIAVALTWDEGTLSPDEKPTGLGPEDEGRIFRATDFDRLYRWNGTAWVDLPNQMPRGAFVDYDTLGPGAGWQLCDGSTVNRSTPGGGVEQITVPDYTTAAYVKLKGGPHTVGPSAPAGQLAAAGGHFHTVNSHTHSADYSTTHDHGRGSLSAADSFDGTDINLDGSSVAAIGHGHSVTGRTATASPSFTGALANASPNTDTVLDHSHGPGTLELRNTELKAFVRL